MYHHGSGEPGFPQGPSSSFFLQMPQPTPSLWVGHLPRDCKTSELIQKIAEYSVVPIGVFVYPSKNRKYSHAYLNFTDCTEAAWALNRIFGRMAWNPGDSYLPVRFQQQETFVPYQDTPQPARTLIVEGLDPRVTREQLHAAYTALGRVVHLELQSFATQVGLISSARVTFAHRDDAVRAMDATQGKFLLSGQLSVRLQSLT
eukprot:gnl/Dysnectes_brevis/6556_a10261_260.p1 GENE.gnl/Dysnectes_brevis/6556_a10261_260~~gnl/Dysnectes_brevis/6556_a10261_260.p1  ORF type:complete len:202 (+),score=65.68 gnl/Dysnectes_brevis/6556_a10261_260:320-925(+)